MFESGILEVAIGIMVVYLLVSLLCASVREGIESWTKTRAAYLEYGIRELLHDRDGSGLAAHFFNHPLIYGLYAESYRPGRSDRRPGLLARGENLPSYIPKQNFALALLDMAVRGPKTDGASSDPNSPVLSVSAARANLLNLENHAVQRVLLTAIDSAQGDLDAAREHIEAWYDSGMERVAGWYKRSTQWIIFWIAAVVAVAGNFDTLTIAEYLYHNDAARAALVERANVTINDPTTLKLSYDQAREAVDELRLPVGWAASASPTVAARPSRGWGHVVGQGALTLLGWLMTALAATLGAPFWFDMLKKVMVIRGTIKPATESAELRPVSRAARGPVLREEAASAPVPALAILTQDAADHIDGCGSHSNGHYEETPDHLLPVATGGVA